MKFMKSFAVAAALLFSVSVVSLQADDCAKKCDAKSKASKTECMKKCDAKSEVKAECSSKSEASKAECMKKCDGKSDAKAEATTEKKEVKQVTKNESK